MPSLSNLMEDYRNWRGRQEWEQGKGWQDFFGGDPRAQEQFEKLSGFGTDAGGLVGMIKASHGSPHAFTKFDFSKIGTGEGAQAYGHGGYFAQGFDSPVAKEYQKQLAADVQLKGQPFYSGKSGKQLATTGNPELDDYLMANLGDVGAARANLLADLRDVRSGGGDVKDYQRTLADLRNIRGDVENTDLGHLYNVELRWPDAAREAADPLGEHHLLDWDAPLSEQPEAFKGVLPNVMDIGKVAANKVKVLSDQPGLADWAKQDLLNDAKQLAQSTSPAHVAHLLKTMQLGYGISPSHGPFANVADDFLNFVKATQAVPNMNTGGGAVSYLEALHGEKGASDALRKAGIPGIRYLDQASRGQGAGTRNYVMFDDAFPNIVSRNGVSLSDLLRR